MGWKGGSTDSLGHIIYALLPAISDVLSTRYANPEKQSTCRDLHNPNMRPWRVASCPEPNGDVGEEENQRGPQKYRTGMRPGGTRPGALAPTVGLTEGDLPGPHSKVLNISGLILNW